MMKARMTALMQSQYQAWNSPPEIMQLLHAGWPDGVDVDPCSNDGSIVGASITYDETADGLSKDWSDGLTSAGLVYVNPPYGKALPVWAAAIASQHKAMRDAGKMHAIISLVPARTDTAWFRSLLDGAEGVIFLAGRVKFIGAPASAPFPSVLVVHQYGAISRVRKVAAAAKARGGIVFNA